MIDRTSPQEKFRILDHLGRGSFAEAYLAEDTMRQRKVGLLKVPVTLVLMTRRFQCCFAGKCFRFA